MNSVDAEMGFDDYVDAPGRFRVRRELMDGMEFHRDLPHDDEHCSDLEELIEEMMAELVSDFACDCCGKVVPVRRVTLVSPGGVVHVLYEKN